MSIQAAPQLFLCLGAIKSRGVRFIHKLIILFNMKKLFMLGAMVCALVMVTACKSGTVGENTNDSTKQIVTTDETQLTDEQWREQWLNGELLDLTKSERNYAAILRNDIDTSTPYNIVEQYYPRSVEEMNILYDSIDIHCNFDNPYENRYNMIYHVLYMNAYRNRGDCLRLYLKMFFFMDPRRLDVDWIAEENLDVYYYLAQEQSAAVLAFCDTLNPKYKGFVSDWYESATHPNTL